MLAAIAGPLGAQYPAADRFIPVLAGHVFEIKTLALATAALLGQLGYFLSASWTYVLPCPSNSPDCAVDVGQRSGCIPGSAYRGATRRGPWPNANRSVDFLRRIACSATSGESSNSLNADDGLVNRQPTRPRRSSSSRRRRFSRAASAFKSAPTRPLYLLTLGGGKRRHHVRRAARASKIPKQASLPVSEGTELLALLRLRLIPEFLAHQIDAQSWYFRRAFG
jgi:hypothetical protein